MNETIAHGARVFHAKRKQYGTAYPLNETFVYVEWDGAASFEQMSRIKITSLTVVEEATEEATEVESYAATVKLANGSERFQSFTSAQATVDFLFLQGVTATVDASGDITVTGAAADVAQVMINRFSQGQAVAWDATQAAPASSAIAEIEAQGALEPGQPGWWQVWGASILDVQAGDVVVDRTGPYEVHEVTGRTLTQVVMQTSEGEICAGLMAVVKIIRKGTHHTLADTAGDAAASRRAYDALPDVHAAKPAQELRADEAAVVAELMATPQPITWHRGRPDADDLAESGDWYAKQDGQVVATACVREGTPTGYWGRYRLWIPGVPKTSYEGYPSTLKDAKQTVASLLAAPVADQGDAAPAPQPIAHTGDTYTPGDALELVTLALEEAEAAFVKDTARWLLDSARETTYASSYGIEVRAAGLGYFRITLP